MADATITSLRPSPQKGEVPSRAALKQPRYRAAKRGKAGVTTALPVTPATVTPPGDAALTKVVMEGRGVTVATTVAALALATVSAGFSITGMTSIFVGALWPVIGMGVALELGKLSAVACIGRRYGSAPLRAALVVLVAVLMGLNAIGAYGFLAKAHIGHAVAGDVAVAGRDADIEARLSVQAGGWADLDRRMDKIQSD